MECRTLRDATGTPELNHLSPAPYVVIDSPVAPGSQELLQALSVLEQLSTLVKASRHGASEYEHYALFPLEGVWALIENDKTLTFDERVAPGKIMMRQADSVTLAEFHEHRLSLGQTIGKGHERYLNTARLVTIDEGPCVQILHLGP